MRNKSYEEIHEEICGDMQAVFGQISAATKIGVCYCYFYERIVQQQVLKP